ncbi:MAG: ethanolamine ammonia-lyase subunit EutC [Beijerinckiaceae bacterium]|nr:ethanolamine ammonia-lyase subunit EutC [Beijerinckiaceae bacterium]
MTDSLTAPDPWGPLRHMTPARIGLGRAGDAPPLKTVLDFQFAHAKARDAVHAALDTEAIAAAFPGRAILQVKSAAPNRAAYLRRPDLGRQLDPDSRALLEASAGSACDVVFVISDGLSATAVRDHAVPFVQACLERFTRWRIGPLVIATQARVALADEVGALLGARICASVIGERPGLSVADSLGVYLTYGPRVGRRDSERNCISNIHPHGGLTSAQAADRLLWLTGEALRRNVTGVALKDDGGEAPFLDATVVNGI